jgi:hypothetical protein
MISLTEAQTPLNRSLLAAPGGYAWWYMDLLGPEDQGCVLIWSFGLPFLPGRESAFRAGRPRPAAAEPSLNVAVYRRGRAVLYTLCTFAEQDAGWSDEGETVWMGRNRLVTKTVGGERVVEATLDLDLPDGRALTGSFQARGPQFQTPDGFVGDPRHVWSPLLTACAGEASFDVGGEAFLRLGGRAYHDRNGCEVPLSGLGLRHWIWGRAAVGSEERIWYLLWPEQGAPMAWGFEVRPDGSVSGLQDLNVVLRRPTAGWFGMPAWADIELQTGQERPWLRVAPRRVVDDGFFYLRWIVDVAGPDGVSGVGFGEAVRPGRVDRAWNRPLVNMAVHRTNGRNSPFLRLFAGAQRARSIR